MEIQFDSINEIIAFLEEIGYTVEKKSLFKDMERITNPFTPVTPNIPSYPYPPITVTYDANKATEVPQVNMNVQN